MWLFVCLGVLFVSETSAQCNPGAVFDSASNRCLQFYRPKVSFAMAESICAASFGHLTSVKNAVDNNFIASRALEYFDGSDNFWIGAKATAADVTNPLNWAWNDGSAWSYQNWRVGQPTSQGDTSCTSVQVSSSKWLTATCSSNFSFVCSFPTNVGATCPPPIIPSHCPSGYTYYSGTDFCYKNTVRSGNFNDARSTCQADGGELASIHSMDENDFLVELSKAGMEVKDDHWNDQVWIGFTFENQKWGWTDGTAVDFVNWADGEPNVMQTDWWTVLVADPHQNKHNTEYMRWNNVGHLDERAFLCKRAPLH
ncbi:unnamed protein product [Caenorhabditis auriculariae]|uniref:C-type lectin domain-containing protein n=1 Tax=Caenorhabditis auriculariae TaxID=2777116 RepID=A0A8S1H8S3_9PELO|nr:unnamed protein product [Caenorhabditis auriculariae]